ncbi:prephenate dehydrogenase [Mycoplasmatota bacterium WC30]
MNIGIVGLGLIGGTIAKSLNKHHHISAYDTSKETIDYAIANQVIHKAYDNIGDFLAANDVVYLCLYPKSIINFIFKNKDLFPKNSVLVEISGIKKHMIDTISNLKLDGVDIIYTHPVAGSEKTGVFNAKKSIFKNANYIITPVPSNKENNIDLVRNLAIQMGFKNISLITAEEHDDIIAYTSQLTHILSLSLVNSVSTQLDTKKFIGDSYRDLTRISIINEKLWPELFLNNKASLLAKIEAFEAELHKFKEAIKMNNNEILEELMIKSTSIRTSIERGEDDES